jgi:hypothetical protein
MGIKKPHTLNGTFTKRSNNIYMNMYNIKNCRTGTNEDGCQIMTMLDHNSHFLYTYFLPEKRIQWLLALYRVWILITAIK